MGRDAASAEMWLLATTQERHSTPVQGVSAISEAKEPVQGDARHNPVNTRG